VAKLELRVATVGEQCGVCGIAVLVIPLIHLHHRVLLVLEPCISNTKLPQNTCTSSFMKSFKNFVASVFYNIEDGYEKCNTSLM